MQYYKTRGEEDSDIYNGWTFHPYASIHEEVPSNSLVSTNFPQYSNIVSSNQTKEILENYNFYIRNSRSQPRHKETSEICFDITYHPRTKKEKTYRIQITKLIDLTDDTVKYQEITDAINDWINVAIEYPDKNRKCIFCNKRAIKSLILCKDCKYKYYKTIYA